MLAAAEPGALDVTAAALVVQVVVAYMPNGPLSVGCIHSCGCMLGRHGACAAGSWCGLVRSGVCVCVHEQARHVALLLDLCVG